MPAVRGGTVDVDVTHMHNHGGVHPSRRVYEDACFFLVRLTLSRFSTCSSVCELSMICAGGQARRKSEPTEPEPSGTVPTPPNIHTRVRALRARE